MRGFHESKKGVVLIQLDRDVGEQPGGFIPSLVVTKRFLGSGGL